MSIKSVVDQSYANSRVRKRYREKDGGFDLLESIINSSYSGRIGKNLGLHTFCSQSI